MQKNTNPLLNSPPHKDSIPYLGDGSWGVNLRTPKPLSEAPYLATAQKVNVIWLITPAPSPSTLPTTPSSKPSPCPKDNHSIPRPF